MATRIDTVGAREKLKPRREPYWQRVRKGCYVGFRKSSSKGGGWLARAREEGSAEAKQRFQPLGEFIDIADHLRFDAATKAASAWFEHMERGGQSGPTTVRVACARYVEHVRALKGDKVAKDVEQRFNNYVLDDKKLADTVLPMRAVRGLLWGVRLNVESAGLASDRDGDLAGQARSAAHQNRLVRQATLSRAAGRNQAAIHGLGRAAP